MKTKPVVLVATAAAVIICWISLERSETTPVQTTGNLLSQVPDAVDPLLPDETAMMSSQIAESFSYVELTDVLAGMDARSQRFTIDPHKECTVQGTGGAVIVIPAYSIVDDQGKVPKGEVTLTLSEYDDVSEILAARLQTRSDGRMLETAGMLHVSVSDGDEVFQLKEGTSFEIRMPRRDTDTDYILFEGERDQYDYMNWEVAEGEYRESYEMPETGERVEVVTRFSPELTDASLWEDEGDSGDLDLNCFIQVQSSHKRDLYYITKMDHYKWKFQDGGMDLNTYFISNFNPDPEMLDDFCSNKLVCEIQLTLRTDGTIRHSYVTKTSKPEYDKVLLDFLSSMPRLDVSELMEVPDDNNAYVLRFGGGRAPNRLATTAAFRKPFLGKEDEEITATSSDDLRYYIFNSSGFGWINVDRFLYEGDPLVNMRVNSPDADSCYVSMIFEDMDSVVLGINEGGSVVFNDVPKGREVKIVSVRCVNGKPDMCITRAKTAETPVALARYEPFSLKKLDAEFNSFLE